MHKPMDAVFLSVETMVTIGYGVPHNYWQGCWSGLILLTVQVRLSLLPLLFTLHPLDRTAINLLQRLVGPSRVVYWHPAWFGRPFAGSSWTQ